MAVSHRCSPTVRVMQWLWTLPKFPPCLNRVIQTDYKHWNKANCRMSITAGCSMNHPKVNFGQSIGLPEIFLMQCLQRSQRYEYQLQVLTAPLLPVDDSRSTSQPQSSGRHWKITNHLFFFFRKERKIESITYTAQRLNKQRGEAKLQLQHGKEAGGVQGSSCPQAWIWVDLKG